MRFNAAKALTVKRKGGLVGQNRPSFSGDENMSGSERHRQLIPNGDCLEKIGLLYGWEQLRDGPGFA